MGLDDRTPLLPAQDEFTERLRRVSEAREFQRGYAVQVRDAALASWAGLVVAVVGLWLWLLLISDAPPRMPTVRSEDLPPSLPKPAVGASRAMPPTLFEINARWFEQNGGRLSH
jgi:hypothetical protein